MRVPLLTVLRIYGQTALSYFALFGKKQPYDDVTSLLHILLKYKISILDSASSYMERLLRDGGDLDSMDRSLFSCEVRTFFYDKTNLN
jgi:hypothetical protein